MINDGDNLIGVFDSGVGGLSILKELLPNGGNFIYFGDTANLPYGNKSQNEIINFGRKTINFFLDKKVKTVVMACNTSSALAYDTLKVEFQERIKIYPLIQTVAPYIAKTSDIIGVMATEGTTKSGVWTREIKKYNKNASVFELACNDFVKIVENRLYETDLSIKYIKEHLDILLNKGCKKIVLGCTHYPYLMPILTRFANENVFINPAIFMKDTIPKTNAAPHVEFYVSGEPEKFKQNARLFMEINEEIKKIGNI